MYLEKDIISLDCAKFAHVFLVKNEQGWIMIDTGFPGIFQDMLTELAKYQIDLKNIEKILLTHGDVDHIGNLKKILKNANIDTYASKNEIPYLTKKKAYSFRKWLLKIIFRIHKFKNIKDLPTNKIGNLTIFETPGHTPGHVCYQFQNYLFVGDLINTRNNQINLMDDKYTLDKHQAIASIKKLGLDGVDYICPAHGNVIDAKTFKLFQQSL